MAAIDPNSDSGFEIFVTGHNKTNCIFCNRATKARICMDADALAKLLSTVPEIDKKVITTALPHNVTQVTPARLVDFCKEMKT